MSPLPLPLLPFSPLSKNELPIRSTELLFSSEHEFRNRLTGLSYAAEALESELIEGSVNSALSFSKILRSATLQIVRHHEKLRLAQNLAFQSIRPNLVVSSVNDVLSKVFSHPGIIPYSHRIDVKVPPGLLVMADLFLISVVLLNLVENALLFSPGNSRIQLVVSAKPHHILFAVLDRGPGNSFLFDVPQSQALSPHPAVPRTKSIGLGLYTAQMITTMHSGKLSLSPRHHGGTLARLLIPNP